jgi:hypothetical protein
MFHRRVRLIGAMKIRNTLCESVVDHDTEHKRIGKRSHAPPSVWQAGSPHRRCVSARIQRASLRAAHRSVNP